MRVYLVTMMRIKVRRDDELPQQPKGKGGELVGRRGAGVGIGWKAKLITVVSWNITALSCEAKHSRSTRQHLCISAWSVSKVGTDRRGHLLCRATGGDGGQCVQDAISFYSAAHGLN